MKCFERLVSNGNYAVAFSMHPVGVSQLMDIAYREDTDIEDRTIDSHVKRIRKKFKRVDPEFSAIETRYGSGYRWNVS